MRETGERQAPVEVSHVLAFSCIWGVKPHSQPVVGAFGSGVPASVC